MLIKTRPSRAEVTHFGEENSAPAEETRSITRSPEGEMETLNSLVAEKALPWLMSSAQKRGLVLSGGGVPPRFRNLARGLSGRDPPWARARAALRAYSCTTHPGQVTPVPQFPPEPQPPRGPHFPVPSPWCPSLCPVEGWACLRRET